MSTGPVGEWTYLHRRGLRIGAVALFALIFVFWGQPTVVLVIVLVILLLVVLGADRADRQARRGARDRPGADQT